MSFRVFFRCVAEALLARGLRGLAGASPLGPLMADVSRDAFGRWQQRAREPQIRRQVLEAVGAPLAEVRQTAAAVVEEVDRYVPEARADLARPDVAARLRRFLVQVPTSARQALRRPGDPSGTTFPLAETLRSPDQLLALLPVRLARFQPGDRTEGGLVLTDLLGVSGFGEVWLARQAEQAGAGPAVVLKFCLDPAGSAALRRQSAQLALLRRQTWPGVVVLRELYLGEVCCLAHDYVQAADLGKLLDEWRDVALEERVVRATRVVRRLAQLLGPLHRLNPPVVHGNLKPANVLVQRQERGLALWLAEMGSGPASSAWSLKGEHGKGADAERDLARGRGAYTPMYASLQQRLGSPPAPRDDVHALGVIWYQLVVGDWKAVPGKDFAGQLAERGMKREAAAFLGTCLSSEPQQQPRDAREMEERLRDLGHLFSVPARGPAVAPAPAAADGRTVDLGGGVELKLARIQAGSFLMGSREDEEGRRDDEGPAHVVTINEAFYLGVFPVTQAQWRALMGNNPSRFHGDVRPVETVSWADGVAFCRKLRERTGGRYRLPTEAEWEYACRAGTTTPFHFGATLSAEQANYYAEDTYGAGQPGPYREQTTPVGSFPPNAWGLCDMHGNVYEWCGDWYGEGYYAESEENDPQGPRRGSARVIRGGAWSECPALCRSACRDKCAADYRVALIGFRVVLCS
jgi:formylglycine-generating enzyme required for sulfatase activity